MNDIEFMTHRSDPTREAPVPPFLTFWGKAQFVDGGGTGWHPIAYHCLDVAACVERILTVRPLAGAQAARLFRTDVPAAIAFLCTIAALHDIGKFANAFQAKRPDLWPAVLGMPPIDIQPSYHTRDGLLLWTGALRQKYAAALWRGEPHLLTPIVQSVMGHHGRPVGIDRQRDFLSLTFKSSGREAATAFAATAIRLLASEARVGAELSEADVHRATWWVAGLVTTADWIGSNEHWFPYEAPVSADADLRDYWNSARERAESGVRKAGLEPPRPAAHRTFAELTGQANPPTPAQRWAMDVPLPDSPTLFILEDVTGAGKTEAAQILVHRLMAANRASGAFWAMPTQATANAMYGRQAKTLRTLFHDEDGGHVPSLVLAHGKSRMHEGFRSTVITDPGDERESPLADDADVPGEIACAAFLANSSRAALIADVGSGTVDQAILSVLPSKFSTMRLFGLAEKVLVLDEIHAYDAYMSEELKALLRAHAALGGCAIALSATLSPKLTRDLIEEWRFATVRLVHDAGEIESETPYPLATVVSRDPGVARTAVAPAPWSRRRVPVRLIHDPDDAIERLLSASRNGAAGVWIRNTVDSCREAADVLRRRGAENVAVFHARFAQVDRQRREEDVLARFGARPNAERAGSILVATQVVEQSLDLDFDVMVTDLAPIDLLIQRSGRLWRHDSRTRPSGEPGPELLVLTPRFEETPSAEWLDALLPKTKWVYQDAGIMWRTLRTVTQNGAIETPDGMRALIGAVYDDDACPRGLERATDRARGTAAAAIGTARQYVVKLGDGYVGESLIWASDVRVPTRLGDHQTTVRIGRVSDDGSIVPWADESGAGLPIWHRWALSEVRVSRHRLPPDSTPDPVHRAACQTAQASWGRWEQEIPLVPFRFDGDLWRARVIERGGQCIDIGYDSASGLFFV